MPTLMGYDADHPMSRGEVGKEGVAVSSLRDIELLFDGIPLGRGHHLDDHQRHRAHRRWRSTWRWPSSRGTPRARLGGTLQNDMLKEYIAQKEWIDPAAARPCGSSAT